MKIKSKFSFIDTSYIIWILIHIYLQLIYIIPTYLTIDYYIILQPTFLITPLFKFRRSPTENRNQSQCSIPGKVIKKRFLMPFTGSELRRGLYYGYVRGADWKWTEKKHMKRNSRTQARNSWISRSSLKELNTASNRGKLRYNGQQNSQLHRHLRKLDDAVHICWRRKEANEQELRVICSGTS